MNNQGNFQKIRIWFLRIFGVGMLFSIGFAYVGFNYVSVEIIEFAEFPTSTTTTPEKSLTPTKTLEFETSSPDSTITATQDLIVTRTLVVTPTVASTQIRWAMGYVTVAILHVVNQPDGRWVGQLTRFQVVKIYKRTYSHGSVWYLCEWESQGYTQQGWILAKYIQFGEPPISTEKANKWTETPITPTYTPYPTHTPYPTYIPNPPITSTPTPTITPTSTITPTIEPTSPPILLPTPMDSASVVMVGLFTSVTTTVIRVIGFISTTVLSWRKEVRDARVTVIENQKLQFEVEKMKFEVEKMKFELEKKSRPPRPKKAKPEKHNNTSFTPE